MAPSEIRQYIHQLVDKANEKQLDEVLEILQPSSGKYSGEDLDNFYKRVRAFEEAGSNGLSIEESHQSIRDKYRQGGL